MTDDAYEKSRNHLKSIIKKGQEAINEVQKLAKETQIPSDDLVEEWLQTNLTPEKKAELARMRYDYDEERQEYLKRVETDDPFVFAVSDYFGTGEGRTLCFFVSRCYPKSCDYDENRQVINTKVERAQRDFEKLFGDWYVKGIEFLPRKEFFTKYSQYLPQRLVELKDELCILEYHSKLHFNFS
jgi:hypothetical protein